MMLTVGRRLLLRCSKHNRENQNVNPFVCHNGREISHPQTSAVVPPVSSPMAEHALRLWSVDRLQWLFAFPIPMQLTPISSHFHVNDGPTCHRHTRNLRVCPSPR